MLSSLAAGSLEVHDVEIAANGLRQEELVAERLGDLAAAHRCLGCARSLHADVLGRAVS